MANGMMGITGGGANITGVPQIGVLGAQDVIQQGTRAALQNLGQGLGQARQDIIAGTRGLDRQAALSGLLGTDAQAQAFADFQQSPGQQFLQEEAERALLRNQSAVGGLGGGNVLRELQRQAIGLAQQDFANQFQRGQQVLGTQQQAAGNLANLAAQGGTLGANLIGGAAGTLGAQRFQAGQDISRAAQQTAAQQAALQQQLGAGLSDITGQTGANLASLLTGTGANTAQLQQQLATMLANIGTGGATNAAQLQSLAGQFDAAGRLGQGQALGNTISQLTSLAALGAFDKPTTPAITTGSTGTG